ncbi:BAG family molecular chaperone regulator 4-like [Benincasa hispida]|uniref:BAG family molecular chaperone regulator 4-like n=1 Tax=Benincasa hispida TaxID=102211 RepID=UPI0018FF2FD6|nr:BAG family molecular chaperone regulator 4-like [Benincasa hispida]
MMKLRSKRFCRSSTFKFGISFVTSCNNKIKVADDHHKDPAAAESLTEIKWELRPGGMLVQRREIAGQSNLAGEEETITIRVSTVSQFHDISVQPTSTFGELKMILSMVTGLEAREQRLLFKGKERDDCEYLHMVGVGHKDKVLLLEDPAIKERKLHGLASTQPISV